MNPFVYRFGRRTHDLGARTHIMGVLNVTPDSFSDGGRFRDPRDAVAHALGMIEEGADFIDVGGESTRPRSTAYGPGASPVSAEEECGRVLPVITELARATDVPISIDTTKSVVARQAFDAGAVMVNDISGFTFDTQMPAVVAAAGASAVLMHIRGTPGTMQQNPAYADLFGEIHAWLASAVGRARSAGISQILVDVGIGFGKTLSHNLQLIQGLRRFLNLGCPILVGPSRKSFIGSILDVPVTDRLEGTLAAVVACIMAGAHVVRVHDVRAVKRAALVTDAILRA
jgi:dihydropteroate synthase